MSLALGPRGNLVQQNTSPAVMSRHDEAHAKPTIPLVGAGLNRRQALCRMRQGRTSCDAVDIESEVTEAMWYRTV